MSDGKSKLEVYKEESRSLRGNLAEELAGDAAHVSDGSKQILKFHGLYEQDDTDHCSFIAGSIVRRGPLVLAISTGGAAPALAVRIREQLERRFGPEYGDLLQLFGELRSSVAERCSDFERRRALWYELVDSDILDRLRSGGLDAARSRAEELTDRFDAAPSTRRPA